MRKFLFDDALRRYVTKRGAHIQLSREQALAYGLIEPTAEERAQQEADRVEYERQREIRKADTAAWLTHVEEALDARVKFGVEDLAEEILLLHLRDGDGECQGCDVGGYAQPDWPCSTVRTVMAYLGYPAPEWVVL